MAKLVATLDSLDQNAKDMPVSVIEQNGLAVKFEMAKSKAEIEGTLATDGSELSGTWKQNGEGYLPLKFQRVESIPVDSRPQEPKKPFPYSEEEVSYENKQGGSKLAGTLTLPPGAGPFPAVLLITEPRPAVIATKPSCWTSPVPGAGRLSDQGAESQCYVWTTAGMGGIDRRCGQRQGTSAEISPETSWPASSFSRAAASSSTSIRSV